MRILFTLSYIYLPDSRGGTETNTDQLCRALYARGHEVAVLAGVSRRSLSGALYSLRRRLRMDTLCGYPVYRSPYGVVDLRPAIGEVIAHFRPDIVIAQHGGAVAIAQLVSAENLPAVVYVHSPDLPWIGLQYDEVYDPIRFIANSEFTANKLRGYDIEAPVVYNLFDPARYTAATHSNGYTTFINPHPEKGSALALALSERCPTIPFLFVGAWRGPASNELRRAIEARPNVKWLPVTTDMRAVYECTKVLIVPSQVEETWGRVVTEAQFNGIPVLVSDRGALPEAVGDGGLVLRDDVDAWALALEVLWYDRQHWLAMSKRAWQHATRGEIQFDNVIERFLEIITSACAHRAKFDPAFLSGC